MHANELPPLGRYRHFKGGEYRLEAFARNSENGGLMVVYRALYGDGELWVRPLSMWSEPVECDGATYAHRFTYIGE
jgi:hypothetical protein